MKRGVIAVFLMVALVLQATGSVLAGTTGSITGTVVDASTNQPIAGVRITAASPSQTAQTTTDSGGRYTFVSLAPDTYTLTAAASTGHDAYNVAGVTVQADQVQTVTLSSPRTLQQIGTVTSRAASALVKPGTTADVYSINPTTQDKASGLGGGGTLNSAWSAISSVPGVYVAPNQAGYVGAGPSLSIRGGDYDQIGYELDGIPVNRSFDNYPSGPLSSLGQQEVQVYTGATPANSEAEGISGYVNQVIRTGTAPAYKSLDLAIGSPTFYNKIAFETGGANPSRTFSYYFGVGAYNQDYRYGDQFNGASLSNTYGAPLAPCPAPGPGVNRSTVPSCFSPNGTPYTNNGTVNAYALGPYNTFLQSGVQDRDTVLNLHFGLPNKNGSKDDIQLLFDNNHINNSYYDSTNDQGGANYWNLLGGAPYYLDGYQYTGGTPVGGLLPGGYTGGGVSPYAFPSSPTGRPLNATIPSNLQDSSLNDQSIIKLQYQKNFGTNAFLRVYGYTYYSDWMMTGPQTAFANYLGSTAADYELNAHTRGVSLNFSDQLNPQHLLSIQGSYTTSSTLRDNNTEMINGLYGPNSINNRTAVGVLVNPTNFMQTGQCYSFTGAPVGCFSSSGGLYNLNKGAGYFTLQQAANGTVTPASGIMCGTAACQYLMVGNGQYATYNSVQPRFYSASVTDNWRPTDKLTINLGLRMDRFEFQGSNTTASDARQFFYTAWNNQFPNLQMVNIPSQVEGYTEFQPRFGATYTLNPTTVLRASYGRYAQAPNSAYEQYNFLYQAAPLGLVNFVNYGLGNTPAHAVRPEVSNNYDFSLEKSFAGNWSVKLSPFLRKTQDQIQQFYLDQRTNFVSGLNVGNQTSQGVELEVDKGDFSRDGFAGKLSFTYTNSMIRYNREPNGQSVVDGINSSISQYNSFTKAGGGAPCYTTGGAAAPGCGAGTIANPYYNAPSQALLNPNGNYPTFDTFPGPIGVGYDGYGAPYVATLLLQYKKNKFALTPAVQFSGGQRYGAPETTPGINPATCSAAIAPVDPNRYPYGAVGGSGYDATSCTGQIVIPDPYTGQFDGIGAFVAPSVIQVHLQASYDLSKRVTLVGNFANLYYNCFGGTKVPFNVGGACGYGATYGAGSGPQPVGNVYNPGNNVQPFLQTPYDPFFKGFPFNMYFEARIKI